MKKIIWVILTIVLLSSLALFGCNGGEETKTTSPATTAATPQSGGTLKIIYYAIPAGPYGLPGEGFGPLSMVQQFCMEPLIYENLDGTFSPCLATDWKIADDQTSVTFTLRQGVKFSDGSDFNAEAVKWNFERVLAAMRAPAWKSIDVVDTYTVRINLNYYQNTVLVDFASNRIVSPASLTTHDEEWMRWNMIGTGPFIQISMANDVGGVFEKNPNYWQPGKPYLDKIEISSVPDPMSEVAAMKAGQGDVLFTGGADSRAADLKEAGFDIYTMNAGVLCLFPDSANPDSPWSNKLVREAAEYAIDKEKIAEQQGYGLWDAAYQIIHPGIPSYDSSIPGRKYDVEKAKQLLAEAGYPDGFDTVLVTYAMDTGMKDIATAVLGYWAAVGIRAELELPEGSAYIAAYTNGTWENKIIHEAVARFSGNYLGSLTYYFAPPDSGFIMRYQSCARPDGYKEAFDKARYTMELDPANIQAISRLFYDNATVIPTAVNVLAFIAADYVHDADFLNQGSSYGAMRPENIWISK